jgi:hypothetical protein
LNFQIVSKLFLFCDTNKISQKKTSTLFEETNPLYNFFFETGIPQNPSIVAILNMYVRNRDELSNKNEDSKFLETICWTISSYTKYFTYLLCTQFIFFKTSFELYSHSICDTFSINSIWSFQSIRYVIKQSEKNKTGKFIFAKLFLASRKTCDCVPAKDLLSAWTSWKLN